MWLEAGRETTRHVIGITVCSIDSHLTQTELAWNIGVTGPLWVRVSDYQGVRRFLVGLFPRLRLKISTGFVVAGSAASAEGPRLVVERKGAVRVSCKYYVMSLDMVTAAEARFSRTQACRHAPGFYRELGLGLVRKSLARVKIDL